MSQPESTPHAHQPVNQDNLKRSITTPQATGVAFNQIVGGGIVSLTGIAIAMTGGGVPVAFVIAAITVLIVSLPYAAIGSAMPVTGGAYTYSSRLVHPLAGYASLVIGIVAQAGLGIYGIAAGQYMNSLNPWFDPTVTAVVLITFFFVANLLGASIGARLGVAMSVLMLLGFGVFIVVGLSQVDWLNYPPVMPEGLPALLQAAALLTFATGGATVVVELGGEMKRPGRSIPIAMIAGTILAAIMYVAIAVVAAGVLPIDQVAGQPLSTVAAEFLPPVAWQFFILGGAMIAVVSTMNAQLLGGSKGMLAAVDDGWFPTRMGAVNKRFGTPHFLLTGLFVIGLAPVLFRVPLDVLASSVAAIGQIIFVLVLVASLRMRSVHPGLMAAAAFRLSAPVHWTLAIIGILVSAFQMAILASSTTTPELLVVLLVIVVVAIVWAVIRYPRVKRVLAARRALSGSEDAEPVVADASPHP